jgi:nitronate monooxygenase
MPPCGSGNLSFGTLNRRLISGAAFMPFSKRFTELFGVELPIIQAPMAGSQDAELAIAVAEAGGLGSLPCAMLSSDQVRSSYQNIRQRTVRPVNLNFFCHVTPAVNQDREQRWRELLMAYYAELGVDASANISGPSRMPFDEAMCNVVAELKPAVVSFHFGLPSRQLQARVRSSGARIISSATTVEEARWLQDEGCDAIIAQGLEAGGHRGMFIAKDAASQVGTMSLTPQIVDAVKVPVIAAGGIADARGIVAAFALGASAVQMGTAYLRCPESRVSAAHRRALEEAREDQTVVTNVLTGRPARGIVNRVIRDLGPINPSAPEFPRAASALAPLRAKAEQLGLGDFSPLWSGQSAPMCSDPPAGRLTKMLAAEALALMERLRGNDAAVSLRN